MTATIHTTEPTMQAQDLDQIGRTLGRWLAPYVAEHIRVDGGSADHRPPAPYDDSTCRLFVRELGDSVVERGATFFGALADRGELTSVDVKELLGLPNQRSIGANLTVSLRKRVKSLGLENDPWEIDATPDGERTIWRDRAGIASRMFAAMDAERARRQPAGAVA